MLKLLNDSYEYFGLYNVLRAANYFKQLPPFISIRIKVFCKKGGENFYKDVYLLITSLSLFNESI